MPDPTSNFQYCTSTEVTDICKVIEEFVASDWTPAEIIKRINDAEDEINSRLAVAFTLPFTAGVVPRLIKIITARLSSALILDVIFLRGSPNASEYAKILREKVDTDIKRILSGGMTVLDSSCGPVTTQDLVISYNRDNATNPSFGTGEDGEYVEEDGR